MKKFLFTLAALLMAGSMFAEEEYMFVQDFEVSQELLAQTSAKNRQMTVAVMAHFDRYVNVFQVDLGGFDHDLLPAGITFRGGEPGWGMTDIPYMDRNGNEKTTTIDLNANDEGNRFIGMLSIAGYWYPEGTDPDEDDPVTYGAVKFRLGEYEMFTVTLRFDQDFAGGQMAVYTQPACGQDTRGPQTDKAKTTHWCNITVEQAELPVAEAPVFAMDENYTITATCANDYKAYVNGDEVTLPYTVEQTYEEQTIVVSGYGYGEGMENSETVEVTFTVPAKEMPVTPVPVVTYEETEDAVVVTAAGEGTVTLYVDENAVENPYNAPRLDEDYTIAVYATAVAEGMQMSTSEVVEIVVPAKEVPQPQYTDAPVITTEETEDAVIITATGNGTVILYVDGEEVENPYTIEKDEEAQTVQVYATAQEEGKEMGEASMTVTIPAKSVTPVDPTDIGYWLIVIDQTGKEWPYELKEGANHDWTTVVAFDYDPFGQYNVNVDPVPNVPFYFKVDGVRLGANEADTEAFLGDAMQNPLYEQTETFYYLPVGYNYTLGIAIDHEFGTDTKYVYAARAGFTALDEVNGGKTVAGVRYFNMAGQEMSEANGICIAVTTYTDGTTSAVKVMK